jgi:hypothetical protein
MMTRFGMARNGNLSPVHLAMPTSTNASILSSEHLSEGALDSQIGDRNTNATRRGKLLDIIHRKKDFESEGREFESLRACQFSSPSFTRRRLSSLLVNESPVRQAFPHRRRSPAIADRHPHVSAGLSLKLPPDLS